MKKILIISVSFLFVSCAVPVPFKVETPQSVFTKNADGSLSFGYKPKAPIVDPVK